ncbi:MAG: chitobiase/beta-hexosaminidase C-terminal domain-containing protein, partial [Anaerovoracaceae bacterium]
IKFVGLDPGALEQVEASVPTGKIVEGTEIKLYSTNENVEIRYTLDGSEVTEKSKKYEEPIALYQNAMIIAAAFDAEGRKSEYAIFPYTVAPVPVRASVEGGTVEVGTKVELSTKSKGVTIVYTLDGSSPGRNNGEKYTGPIEVRDDMTLRGVAYYEGREETTGLSEEKSWKYRITPLIQDRYETNERFEEATAISFPTYLEALISTTEDVDTYKFTQKEKGTTEILLETPKNCSYSLELFDQKGKSIGKSQLEKNQGLQKTLEPGTYYVQVKSIKGASDKADYRLNLHKQAINPADVDLSEMNHLAAIADTEKTRKTTYAQEGVLAQGGHFAYSLAYFSLWNGPVWEEAQPYEDLAEKVAYKDIRPEQNLTKMVMFPAKNENGGTEAIKNGIKTYGAASTYMFSYNTAWDATATNFYAPAGYRYITPYDGGHIITLVGWDDGYPKENFVGNKYTASAYGYDDFETGYTQPKEDGAWICKNSWGEEYGEGGYFYISYEDSLICSESPTAFFAENLPGSYRTQYANDRAGAFSGMGTTGPLMLGTVIQTGEKPESLQAVGILPGVSNTEYEVYLKKLPDQAAGRASLAAPRTPGDSALASSAAPRTSGDSVPA